MALALRLARRGLGRVAPNPAVGCLLVREGRIVARGWTQPGGRPHAETMALAAAGEAARGATAYVTLEPCAHEGRTPSCARTLIETGVQRVVSAIEDPDLRTAGGGHAMLRKAGIAVTTGIRADEAAELNRGFFLKIREKRPLVTLKLALSLDGRIATRTGHSRWITGKAARHHAHGLRARHDAILVGAGTARADDPALTCRLPGLEDASPIRILLSRDPACPGKDSRLMASLDDAPVWLVGPKGEWAKKRPRPDSEQPQKAGLYALPIEEMTDDGEGEVAPPALLAALAGAGITRLLVEGGAHTAGVLLASGCVDRLVVYHGACLIGGDGLAGLPALGIERVDRDAPRFRLRETIALEETVASVYEPLQAVDDGSSPAETG
ncbi:MAG: bifunctional diaminohydroxyphosphoribosylaminopyrimidine deaminase/5-amino-6-(5-phosphoribosylamino)uracil reductase RibD [Alphaproteobacteria bacterium]|nr:MAG: bifunctional diaminohydroxyphosphoribosylaminopyrimidine deaminase/5-amino-6-(5-phosphoribosylamino)uracil reductase RibD [Alphaproteobacteria bacterium]